MSGVGDTLRALSNKLTGTQQSHQTKSLFDSVFGDSSDSKPGVSVSSKSSMIGSQGEIEKNNRLIATYASGGTQAPTVSALV
jgi:hypothetical protein